MPASTSRFALPYPTPDDTVDVPRDVQALATKLDTLGFAPTGALMLWLTATAPAGWLLCDGATVPAANYPGLASVLGSSGGNVTLPDLRGRVPLGVGTATGAAGATNHVLGAKGGEETHDLQLTEIPAHDHAVTLSTRRNSAGFGSGALAASDGSGVIVTTAMDVGDNGGGLPHNNLPPFVALNFIIRAA